MKRKLVLFPLLALPIAALLVASKSPVATQTTQIERGRYLVNYGGCHDCHTPIKMTPAGPVPDMKRMLSGHQEGTPLPPPDLKPGPWFAATAGMTAWAGPWGISYAANLTPDTNTGIGIWTEDMFVSAMKTGRHLGSGRPILPPMPWQNVGTLSNDDLRAVFAYLKSIPAIQNRVLDPQPPADTPTYE